MSREDEPAISKWPRQLTEELRLNDQNGRIGILLASQTDQYRIWQIRLEPGERVPFHRHVLDYFWTSLADGTARSHFGDGRVSTSHYKVGDTKHFKFARGESMIHDLENIGDTTLLFTTVESLKSENKPLPVA